MNESQNIQRDTPLRRFTTFLWGMALFSVFGIASVLAYWSIDKSESAYSMMSEERMKLTKEVEDTQAELLSKKEINTKMTPELKAEPKKTEIFVPGTPSHTKATEVPVPATGASLDGQKLFIAKSCQTCHGNDGKSPIAPIYPVIAGKESAYLTEKMQDIKSGKHTTALTPLMMAFISACSTEEIEAMSQWLSSVK